MKKSISFSVVAASVAIAFGASGAAFAAKVPAGVKLDPKQELVRSNGSEPESLDISQIETTTANNIARDLFEGLTAVENTGKIVPGVASSWKQKDPTTWIFNLRKDAKWSNGDPVTADDFVYSWRRTVDPKTATKYGLFHEFIANGKDIMSGKKQPAELGIKAVDKYTLEIKTEIPVAFLPDMLANSTMAPLHKASFEKFGKDFTKPGNLVSNGAYVLKDWIPNSRIVLEKNAKYWDAKNTVITKVTFDPTESEDAALKMYKAGQVDMTLRIPAGTFQALKAEMPKELSALRNIALYYYGLNNKDPVLKDKRVRQALSMVIDRDILTQKLLGEGQVPAYSLMVQGTAGADVTPYEWAKWPMEKRVAEAKKLLAAAGVTSATPLKLMYNTSESHKRVGLFISSEWKTKLGLSTSMENQEFKVFLKTRHSGQYQVARNGWNADYNDATTFLDLVRCDSDQNDQQYCNKKVDELMAQGNQQTDQAKRKALMTQASKLAMDDYPLIPLYQYVQARTVKPYVGGYYTTNSFDRFRTSDFYIIKK